MTLTILHPSYFHDYAQFARILDQLRAQSLPPLTRLLTLASSASQQQDPTTTLTGRYAQAAGIPCEAVRPYYARQGQHAERNCSEKLLQQADGLVVFSDGHNRTMTHALEYARARALKYVVPLLLHVSVVPTTPASWPASQPTSPPETWPFR